MKIYQIYYNEKTKAELDEYFIPYSNADSTDREWREYHVILREYRQNQHLKDGLVAYLSWKFGQKTGVSGQTVHNFIQDNPGYDVYFINPWPDLADSYQNVWEQGEIWHPGLIEFVQQILDELDYGINLSELQNDETDTLFCNYWIGTPDFWNQYMEFTLPIYKYIKDQLSPEQKQFAEQLHQSHDGAPLYPFIMERMFSTLLAFKPEIEACAYQYDAEYKYRSAIKNQTALKNLYLSKIKRTGKQDENSTQKGRGKRLLDKMKSFI